MLCCGLRLKRPSKRPKAKESDAASTDQQPQTEDEQQQQQQQQPQQVSQFAQDMIDRHNAYRQHHQAPALQLSVELTDAAQKWAETMAEREQLEHDPNCQKGQVGENVALKYSSVQTDFPASAFVDSWYSEASEYKFDGTEDQIECGHFSQVVWKGSREAGFGKCISQSGKVYVVGRYRPAGNFTGNFTHNVLPPAGGKMLKLEAEDGKAGKNSASVVLPVIGPDNAGDVMIETKTVTKTVGDKKLVKVTETYRTASGNLYTKSKDC